MTVETGAALASQRCSAAAASLSAVSNLFRGKHGDSGRISISVEMRDQLCDLLETVAKMMDELSIAAGLDAEDLGIKP
jgi:hypothetical protein